jgi:hypothetical protein
MLFLIFISYTSRYLGRAAWRRVAHATEAVVRWDQVDPSRGR